MEARRLQKRTRPDVVKSTTYEKLTGCENLYVTIGIDGGSPLEVFLTLGKSGGCSACMNEALGRAISLGLKYGVPLEEYAKGLRGIRCDNPKIFPKDSRCLSCPDAISGVMEVFLDGKGKNP